MARQQRAPINRRPWRPSTPPRTTIVTPRISSIAGNTLVLAFQGLSAPPVASTVNFPVLMPQIPQVLRAADGTFPTGATRDTDGEHLNLLYGGAIISQAETFYLGPYDSGIRTQTGGFSAPAVLNQGAAIIPTHTWTAVANGGNQCIIAFDNPATSYYLNAFDFHNITTGAQVNNVAEWTAAHIVLQFDASTQPGHQIQYSSTELSATSGTADQLLADTQTAT